MSLAKPHGLLDLEPLMAMIADLISVNDVLHQSHPITWEKCNFLFSAMASATLLKKTVLSLAIPPCNRQD